VKKPELYCFADTLPLCRTLLDSGVKMIQLRAKNLREKELIALGISMMDLIRKVPEARLILNDRADLISVIGAHGVHMGQDDGDPERVRALLPEGGILGVSVDTAEEARAAVRAGADYIGAGALYSTPTKKDAVTIGWNGVEEIISSVSKPVAVIGGITLKDVQKLTALGAGYICVISDINNSPDIGEKVREYHKQLKRKEI